MLQTQGCSLLLREVRVGTQRRNLEAGTEDEVYAAYWLAPNGLLNLFFFFFSYLLIFEGLMSSKAN